MLRGPQPRYSLGGQGKRGCPMLVPGSQVGAALLTVRDHVLDLAVLVLRPLGSRAGLLVGRRQPAGLLLGRGEPAAGGADLAAQPGQPLGARGGGPGVRGKPPLGLSEGGLCCGTPGHDDVQLIARGDQPLPQRRLLTAQPGGFGVELVGIAAWPEWLRWSGQVPVPLAGQAEHPAEAFREAGEAEERLLSRRESGRVLLLGGLQFDLGRTRLAQVGLERREPGRPGRLVGLVALELGGQRRVIVCEQAQPGVAEVSLDARRLP
ncbi:MAG: hypothetical protein JOZ15_04640, partial [Acidobacteria bacterium]|nr:hypothetical protein [Acidobacteriota bacterium]